MNKKLVTMFLVLVLLFAVGGVNNIEAYVLEPYKWKKTSSSPLNVTYAWGLSIGGQTGTNQYKVAFQNAVNDWNASQSKINWSYSLISSNTFDIYNKASTSEYGVNTTTYNATTYFITKVFTRINAGNSGNNIANVARSVANHEIGHAMGLGHSTHTAVMNTSRDRSIIYTPQTDDINGVNARYNILD